jgi:hypothetical protein
LNFKKSCITAYLHNLKFRKKVQRKFIEALGAPNIKKLKNEGDRYNGRHDWKTVKLQDTTIPDVKPISFGKN